MVSRTCLFFCTATSFVASSTIGLAVGGDDPFADEVIDFNPGTNPSPGYRTPNSVLGSPERFTGEDVFPAAVTPFNPPWGADEIYSMGAGGYIVVKFNSPVTNDPNNLYGIDLIVFGNTGFNDPNWPSAVVDGFFGDDGGTIEVSVDGKDWHLIAGIAADGPVPPLAYLDADAYQESPGKIETDFTQPIDPGLNLSHFNALHLDQVKPLYRGSGGGTGIDIGSVGLSQIQYVRIANPVGALNHIEIDAFSDVSPRRPGDVNLDGAVGVPDLLQVINAWGATTPGGPPADFTNDGLVGVPDLLVVINNWGP